MGGVSCERGTHVVFTNWSIVGFELQRFLNPNPPPLTPIPKPQTLNPTPQNPNSKPHTRIQECSGIRSCNASHTFILKPQTLIHPLPIAPLSQAPGASWDSDLQRFISPKPCSLNPNLKTPNPKPQTPNPKPQSPNSTTSTQNPKTDTRRQECRGIGRCNAS